MKFKCYREQTNIKCIDNNSEMWKSWNEQAMRKIRSKKKRKERKSGKFEELQKRIPTVKYHNFFNEFRLVGWSWLSKYVW